MSGPPAFRPHPSDPEIWDAVMHRDGWTRLPALLERRHPGDPAAQLEDLRLFEPPDRWTTTDETKAWAGCIILTLHHLEEEVSTMTKTEKSGNGTRPGKPTKTRAMDGMLFQVSPENLKPWPGLNPRRRFDPVKHQELVQSIRDHGNIQPLLVTPAKEGDDAEYWVAAGERRLRAGLDAKANLLCLCRELTWETAVELAGLENLHRDDLTPVEEALWMRKMLDEVKGADGKPLTQAALAERLDRDQSTVANALRLLRLPVEVLDLIEDGIIGATHARDSLVPFAEIKPEAVRGRLFTEFVKRMRAQADEDGGSFTGREIHSQIADIATRLSKPIVARYQGDRDAPLFKAEEHKDCPCGSPAFDYSRHFAYGERKKEVRCFNEQWWNKAQKEAKKQADRKRAKAEQKIRAQAEKVAGQEVLEHDQLERVHPGYRDKTTIARRKAGGRAAFDHGVLLDVTRLPAESLLVAKDRYGHGLELVCTKVGSVNAAKGRLTKEKKLLAGQLRTEQRGKDLAAVAKMKVEPWMLRLLANEAGKSHHGSAPPVVRAAIDLGFVEDAEYRWTSLEDVELSDAQVDTLVKVFAIRHKRGDFSGWKEIFGARAEEELTKKYEAALQELLPAPAAENGKKAPAKKKARKKAGVA